MAIIERTRGTAPDQGELWGARARDWAEQERHQRALYEQAIRILDVGAGMHVLDVGCGSGYFCSLLADRGAHVSGIDAAEALVDIACERVPDRPFRVGDLQSLPFAGDAFEVVTGFNSFQYAADPVAALGEARRVAAPGARVFALVWGRQERTELAAILRALRPLLPPSAPDAPGPFALSDVGALDELVHRAGLEPTDAGYLEATFEYRDQETLLRATLASGPAILAIRTSGEEGVRRAVLEATAPFRTADGAYRLETEWRYVTAQA